MYSGVCMTFNKDIDKAAKQLADLDKVIQRALPRAAKAGAGELKAEAIRQVPVRTGKLRDGIDDKPGTSSDKTAVNSAVHIVYNRVFYAAPVEYGRYKRPFMRPAVQAANNKMEKAMETAVTRETNKVL